MGVGLELTGRQVRCPHCRQVVVAPTNLPAKPVAALETPAVTRTATPPEAFSLSSEGEIPLPKFAPPERREGAESIFGDSEHEDDSVFAAPTAQQRPFLDLPSSADLPQQPSGSIDFNAATAERQSMPPTDALESGDIPRPILGPATPFIPKDLSQPDFALLPKLESHRPAPAAQPAVPMIFVPPAEVPDPWSKLSRPPAASPLPVASAPASGRGLAALPAPAGRGTLFWLLVSYAAAVTLFAAWGWTRSKGPHPLSIIPDFFGQYRGGDPKKVSALPVDAAQPIPAELRVKLGEKLVIGELEFEPLAVEERHTKWEVRGEGGRPRDVECLVLKARVRNLSQSHAFCPLDPAYNRFASADAPSPLSAVVVGGERFLGGPIPWPFVQGTREFIVGQEQDDQPLEPGRDRTTVLASIDGERGAKLRDAVRLAKGLVLWQVHVRRGFIRYQGEDVSVGALIGVEFTANQVKQLDTSGKSG